MLTPDDQHTLRTIAFNSIQHGLQFREPLEVIPSDYEETCQAIRATFVTLKKQQKLRGCVGTLEPLLPLVVDVAHNAFSAAFRDTRFPPLQPKELKEIAIEISVLTLPVEIKVPSEKELLEVICPKVDGIILQQGFRRATFLPVVWESLPDAKSFISELKLKGGWHSDEWPKDMRVFRYHTEKF